MLLIFIDHARCQVLQSGELSDLLIKLVHRILQQLTVLIGCKGIHTFTNLPYWNPQLTQQQNMGEAVDFICSIQPVLIVGDTGRQQNSLLFKITNLMGRYIHQPGQFADRKIRIHRAKAPFPK
ncbi:hypothetical protein AR543_10055 [Paenibacillus bovis]|uniref:Uncharacterized protein n=1 Tax=Paenibacillus bovis TaxID=1616788 RepID=A0A172ZGQ9_9BACL|nr:hypothetical protein AR543_10055 [Paenibacillus bovis]